MITRSRPAGRSPAADTVPATTLARLSASMNASRATGYPGSSGRYAPPASQVAKISVIISGPGSRHNPTTDSVPTPSCRR